ncbi:hypothetical protein [Streptacidiphilus jiangxiensis]|uniref:Protein kinase domain-containing protein n=1 Tax=Streptacidiphilus jiangxiensis TaxID=235985 RepID=A0A1H8AIS8_STRJI|nr:hypothetical protein [Streptacidiphilus jiangxiensis]SEM69728.1 hypothetical protein SAMN05414137_1452 [Streptacidiphilus jiangxiensis]
MHHPPADRAPASCPAIALAAAEEVCGPVTLEPVTDRRGSAVWRATGPSGTAAVKAGTQMGADITEREATVLGRLPGYTVACGRDGDTAWLVTPWWDGPSTWEVFAPVRAGIQDRAALLAAAQLCRTVADLHADGWVHCDLQPEHAIHTSGGVRLLDWSWAWSPDFPPSPLFRGGLPHLLAPELAASISVGIQPVQPGPACETYTLAALLWRCTTGGWPLDYAAHDLDPDQLRAPQLRALIANRAIPLTKPATWPALLNVLRPALLAPRTQRPRAADLAARIAALALEAR